MTKTKGQLLEDEAWSDIVLHVSEEEWWAGVAERVVRVLSNCGLEMVGRWDARPPATGMYVQIDPTHGVQRALEAMSALTDELGSDLISHHTHYDPIAREHIYVFPADHKTLPDAAWWERERDAFIRAKKIDDEMLKRIHIHSGLCDSCAARSDGDDED